MNKPDLIVPAGIGRRRNLEFPTLLAEADAHMEQAQQLYREALQANADGGSSQHLMHLTITEQNAAMLCHQEALHMLMAVLIGFLMPDDEDEGELMAPPADTGGRIA